MEITAADGDVGEAAKLEVSDDDARSRRGRRGARHARLADRLAALAGDLRARHRVTVTTCPADLSLPDEVSRVAAHAAAMFC